MILIKISTVSGNAMGYIRMIRSGGLHYVSNAVRYVEYASFTSILHDHIYEIIISCEV